MVQHRVERDGALERAPVLRLDLNVMRSDIGIKQFAHQLPAHHMFLDDDVDILELNLSVGDVLGQDAHNGPLGAEAQASRSHDIDHVVDAMSMQHDLEGFDNLLAVAAPAGLS